MLSNEVETEFDGYVLKDALKLLGVVLLALISMYLITNLPVQENKPRALAQFVAMIGVDCLLALCIWPLLKFTRKFPFALRWLTIAIVLAILSVTQATWDAWLRTIDHPDHYFQRNLLEYFFNNCIFNSMITGFLEVLSMNRRLQFKNELLMQAIKSEKLAYMVALRLQLNPHFLFNILNSVQYLIEEKEFDVASRMLGRLAYFLRESLEIDPEQLRTLKDEFDMIESYLDVQNAAFGDTLEIGFHLDPALQRAMIPAFILQPLVENSVKHAGAGGSEGPRIEIHARETDGNRMTVSVVNSISYEADKRALQGAGVGLANTKERLKLIYGEEGNIRWQKDGDSFEVDISLPLQLAV